MHATVPFEFAAPGLPLVVVPTTVNDCGPYRFVLDTGAGHCLLTPRVAQALNLEAGTAKEAVGAGGRVELELSRVASITVGGARVTSLEVGVTAELDALSAVVRSPLDGDLGHNFLKAFCLTVDYKSRVLHLASEGEGHGPSSTDRHQAIPFTLAAPAKPLVLVDTYVNHRGPFRFVVDTGASTSVVGTTLAQQLGLTFRPAAALTGGGGAVPSALTHVDVLRVGHVSVPSVTVAVADFLPRLSEHVGVELEGIVGFNFLREFRVTIDYQRSRLRLE